MFVHVLHVHAVETHSESVFMVCEPVTQMTHCVYHNYNSAKSTHGHCSATHQC